jgi:hypothetical protein
VLASAGAHARAAAEAAALDEGRNPSKDVQFSLACVYALCARSARSDPRLSAREQAVQADSHASRALALLRRLDAAGYFQQAGHLALLQQAPELHLLRDRADFQELLRKVKEDRGR